MIQPRVGLAVTALLFAAVIHAQGSAASATEGSANALARSIFQELIEINTTDSVGSVTTAAAAMAKRFRAAGFRQNDLALLGPNAIAVIRVVNTSGGGCEADATAWACELAARAAATIGSAVVALGCGGPNSVRWGRMSARIAGVIPITRPSSSRVSSGAAGGP